MDGHIVGAAEGEIVAEGEVDVAENFFILEGVAAEAGRIIGADAEFGYQARFRSVDGEAAS